MKRVSVDSRQSCGVDEEARDRLKYGSLLQDYLELQKDFVSEKRKLQIAKQKRGTLLAEVRFLRRRQRYLLNIKSAKHEPEQCLHQQQKSDIQNKMHIKERNYSANEAALKNQQYLHQQQKLDIQNKLHKKQRNYNANEAALKNLPPVLDSKVILDGEEGKEGRNEQVVWEPLRVEKPPKNCLINEKRVGKKKISWQDPMVLQV